MFQFIWLNISVLQNRMIYKLLQTGVNIEAQSNQGFCACLRVLRFLSWVALSFVCS